MTVKEAYLNVTERWCMYDTFCVFKDTNVSLPPGWQRTLANAGNLNKIDFFNIRTDAAGQAWNNQDIASQMAFPMYIESIGVSMFAGSMTFNPGAYDPLNPIDYRPDDIGCQMFCCDLARHGSLELKIQQDTRLRIALSMLPPGYGPFGNGYARGSVASINGKGDLADDVQVDHHLSVNSGMGLPKWPNRWPFAIPLEVARTNYLSAEVKFNQYGRTMLQTMPDYFQTMVDDNSDDGYHTFAPVWGIQVSIAGRREAQQRGRYFA